MLNLLFFSVNKHCVSNLSVFAMVFFIFKSRPLNFLIRCYVFVIINDSETSVYMIFCIWKLKIVCINLSSAERCIYLGLLVYLRFFFLLLMLTCNWCFIGKLYGGHSFVYIGGILSSMGNLCHCYHACFYLCKSGTTY